METGATGSPGLNVLRLVAVVLKIVDDRVTTHQLIIVDNHVQACRHREIHARLVNHVWFVLMETGAHGKLGVGAQ
uniref:Uncharacterized protein n=1 Tax=Arion vulgaris TaxID=1028688 RepID=A0A0B7A439_9EUPU